MANRDMKNRELRFRVWDKEYGDWILEDDIAISNGGILIYGHGGIIGGWHIPSDQDNLIIQQYTGLKDKNGKEIFEGDIIKEIWNENQPYGYNPDEIREEENIFIVKYSPPSFDFPKIRHEQIVIEDYSREIIGNIFENPELLK